MHAYMCLCGCVSVCLFVARAMFSFFLLYIFLERCCQDFCGVCWLLWEPGLNLPRGLSARSSLQIRTSTSLAFERVNHIHSGDGLALCVFGISNGITDAIL